MTVYVKMITGVEENHMLAAAFDIDRVKERLDSGNVMWRQKVRVIHSHQVIREG